MEKNTIWGKHIVCVLFEASNKQIQVKIPLRSISLWRMKRCGSFLVASFPTLEKKYVAVLGVDWFYTNTLELPPTQYASDHQDYSIFSRESWTKPSFVTVTSMS